jgi:thiopurine S-methyltransferase
MEPQFWHERWQQQQIGFHKQEINLYLKFFWPGLGLGDAADCPVLVPLCGKSNDLLWLNRQGHEVLGVEISPIAVQAFFEENHLTPEITRVGELEYWRSGTIEIICGDFFAVPKEAFSHIVAVYDRASLVALPAEMRDRYASRLMELLGDRASILLVTLEYPQEQMNGPPFSVTREEVESLYQHHFTIELAAEMDVLDDNAHLKEKGVTRLIEKVYKLNRN